MYGEITAMQNHCIVVSNVGIVAYTPVPQSFWLILQSSEARFISSCHLPKTIVSQSDESDLCLSTVRSVSDVSGVI